MDLGKKKYRNSPALKLTTFFKTIAKKIFKFGNCINLLSSYINVIRNTTIADPIIFKNDITGFRVAIPRLTNGSYIAKSFTIIKQIREIKFFWALKLINIGPFLLHKNARNMSVTLKTIFPNE